MRQEYHITADESPLVTIDNLHKENERLKGLLRKATKALTCCTIMTFDTEKEGVTALNAIGKVTMNIWRILESPDGKPNYIWWEKQIDPNVQFVNKDGSPYEYSARSKNNT